MKRRKGEDIVKNRDRAVPEKVPFEKTLFRILVTQPERSHSSSLFCEPAQSSCRAELRIPVHNVNWNRVLSSEKTLILVH